MLEVSTILTCKVSVVSLRLMENRETLLCVLKHGTVHNAQITPHINVFQQNVSVSTKQFGNFASKYKQKWQRTCTSLFHDKFR